MSEQKYWQSFGELNQSEGYQESAPNEFREDLPFEDADGKGLLDAQSPRRDFLKYLGFSTAAAMAAASCEIPVKKSIPYVNRPDSLVPGIADYYATTYIQDGDVIPVIAKVRDGRPIKLEGNETSAFTKGGTSSRAQASVLDLYDMARLRFPQKSDGKGGFGELPFADIDKIIGDDFAALGGKPVAILSSTINSPSTLEAIKGFLAKFPGSFHVNYDAVSYSGMLLANEASYGKRAIPSYHFDKARLIVSLGADFLGTWLNPVEFSRQYAKGRKITNEQKAEMSRHFQFESHLSMTGANSDERFTHLPSEAGAVAAALLGALGGTAVSLADKRLKAGVEKAAAELKAHAGEALVVSGSNDVNVQIIVNAINEAIGANGKTINWALPVSSRLGIDADMAALVDKMNNGDIGALLVIGANPAYTWHDAAKFATGMQKLKFSVSFNERMDETTQLCKYSVPTHHFLESWGDAELRPGYLSFQQPTINPLFKTRPFQTSLLKWSGVNTEYADFFKAYWTPKLGGADALGKAMQAGVSEPAEMPVGSAPYTGAARATEALARVAAAKKSSGTELVIYQKVSLGDGKQAGNPWLQELPDPITKATWDNYVMISPAMAKSLLGIDISDAGQSDDYEAHPQKPVVSVKMGDRKPVALPALIVPGMHPGTIAIAVGYGRHAKVGRAAQGAGQNAYPFTSFNGTTVDSFATVTVTKTGETYKVAQNQSHGLLHGRIEVVKEITLGEFQHNPKEILQERQRELGAYGGTDNFTAQGTLYPVYDRPGARWGMSIDLNSCTGCAACVVACNAENNIPVVGKREVMRGHELHWMRIDRYFTGDMENPDVIFQPMLCQHCDNAPCENVCPVAATNHSSEGVNQMIYNRCIGTRYCANNCPFKVRRFNWSDYTGADSFPDNQRPLVEENALDEIILTMNEPLTRMVLNPDVTVRSRGVIEKCSFCVQRTQEAKLTAKKENRPLKDGDVKTACMQACPTEAIVFGNANDKESRISKIRTEESPLRLFYSLEQLHVLPSVNYLTKVRHKDHGVAAHGGEKKDAPAAEKHS